MILDPGRKLLKQGSGTEFRMDTGMAVLEGPPNGFVDAPVPEAAVRGEKGDKVKRAAMPRVSYAP
ncbi:hypothetical protein J8J14_10040 [Roseomonas sp. SSH11]|uniref:Uncharacterized protein n=1 Tax=Pararoseomonas baculiformis TaxID=2820812 RepID=A0ABS4AFU8_9PROT|nr:hypothetical protein [Pararoseomonas baculiformis]MBP0445119.1 hypothetical protein [Pararoseomonas baculiformis]